MGFLFVAVMVAIFALNSNLRAALITIETVTVGDAGNAADTTGFGAVAYDFKIGKYEVTIGQYTAFLNAVAATDAYSLYNPSMATDLSIAGIAQSGGSGTYSYSVIGSGNRPISYVSWFDAARFANWMNNGATTNASTETGAYTLNGATSGVEFIVNPEATWWIPSENQWYKAAYFSPDYVSPYDSPNLGGPAVPGGVGYYVYPTQSDTAPGNTIGGATNQANYRGISSVYSVTQSASFSSTQNYLTDAGAFSNSASAYGTFDQAGNVYEWNDAVIDSARGLRGGGWEGNDTPVLRSSFRAGNVPTDEDNSIGFRLAGAAATPIPEPGTWAAMAVFAGGAAFAGWRRRRQKRLAP
jgi:sulfatase modifying factor 1